MMKLYSFIGWLIIYLLSKTIRVKTINDSSWKDLKNVIFTFWHGEQFILCHHHRNQKIAIMTSLSKDGELQTGILGRFGYYIVRGSSSRGGARAIIEMKNAMKAGYSAAFAVDGPRGPLYEVKPGVIFLAQKTGFPIIPMKIFYSTAIMLKKTWDKYRVPLPFSTAIVVYGNPVYISGELSESEVKSKCEELKRTMSGLIDLKTCKFQNRRRWKK